MRTILYVNGTIIVLCIGLLSQVEENYMLYGFMGLYATTCHIMVIGEKALKFETIDVCIV